MPSPGKNSKSLSRSSGKAPAGKSPIDTPAKGAQDPREALYRERWKIHEKCPHNYPGGDCYIANQTDCTQFRLLHEPQCRCPGQPKRW
jgi:hypothetical protein